MNLCMDTIPHIIFGKIAGFAVKILQFEIIK